MFICWDFCPSGYCGIDSLLQIVHEGSVLQLNLFFPIALEFQEDYFSCKFSYRMLQFINL